ncbi:MAG: hypothetical protein JNK29_06635, partial [Anaerolineales bacterium]|nr:hypothetical protein [Anaerolineales bacterium]
MRNPRLRSLPAHLGHSLIGLLILFYTYLFLFEVPLVGFGWDGGSGRVLDVRSTSKLQVGDRLVQVGSVPFEGLRANRHQSLLQDARPGQPLTVVVERDGQLLTLDIQVADTLDWREVRSRLTGPWLLGMVFWLFGTLTLVLVRPRDNRWRL